MTTQTTMAAVEDPLLSRVARLRWRSRLFRYGPAAGFAVLATMVLVLKAVNSSTAADSHNFLGSIWIIGASVVLTWGWCAVCLWWAPAARCPRCDQRMGAGWFSPLNALWMWFSRPICRFCKFDPFRESPSAARD
jgi:hypothetical protein